MLKKFSLVFLQKENVLNKLLKKQRSQGGRVHILYTSLWDETSQKLVETLKNKYGSEGGQEPLYVINSFTMPHSFVIFKTTHLPHLVILKDKTVSRVDYLPHVYHHLNVATPSYAQF